jgi:hypothetical protein
VLRAHDIATLAAALVFGARFLVKEWLYLTDSTTWLAVAKIAMGTPLTVLGALVVVWAFRRTTKRLVPPAPWLGTTVRTARSSVRSGRPQ